MKYKISANVIKRLPRYVRTLDSLAAEKTEKISSNDLGLRLGLTASQIRQDFNCFGGFGHQGYGYNVVRLREHIAGVLGIEQTLTAVVIGAGNLGHAIMANFNFDECGVQLVAAFDTSERLIGTTVSGIRIMNAELLGQFLSRNHVDVAVMTLPKRFTDETARTVIRSGVRGIWNFTGCDIDVGNSGVIVEDVHLSDSLLNLGYYLRNHGDETEEGQDS
jgi:redox-sensing transcriptional repressor